MFSHALQEACRRAKDVRTREPLVERGLFACLLNRNQRITAVICEAVTSAATVGSNC